jgi:hypothetical protein
LPSVPELRTRNLVAGGVWRRGGVQASVILPAALGISLRDCRSFAQIRDKIEVSCPHLQTNPTRPPHLLFLGILRTKKSDCLPTSQHSLFSPQCFIAVARRTAPRKPVEAPHYQPLPPGFFALQRPTRNHSGKRYVIQGTVLRLLKNLDWGAEVGEGSATTVFRGCAHTVSGLRQVLSPEKVDTVDRD